MPENGLDGSKGNAAPLISVPSADQQRRAEELTAAIRQVEAQRGRPTGPLRLGRNAEAAPGRTLRQARFRPRWSCRRWPKPRETFVLVRGQYDKPGEKVDAGVPAFLPPLPAGHAANRLGLARGWSIPRIR